MGAHISNNLRNWILAARPKTLTAAFVPVLAASALADFETGQNDLWITICALVSAICIQVATNFINDYIDFEKGADTHERLGPIRVTQKGLISKSQLKFATILVMLVAFLFGIPLVMQGGWPIVFVGIVSALLAYGYTGGPFPLAYLGLGDLFVVLFFGVIAVNGVFYLQTMTVSFHSILLGIQIGLLAAVLIAINNFRDMNQDLKANKKTLPVRFGARFARIEICCLLILPFLLQLFWYEKLGLVFAAGPLILLPIVIQIARFVHNHNPSIEFNNYLARSAALHGGFGLIMTLILYSL